MARRQNRQRTQGTRGRGETPKPELNISEYLQSEKTEIMLNGETLKEEPVRDEAVLAMFEHANDIDKKDIAFTGQKEEGFKEKTAEKEVQSVSKENKDVSKEVKTTEPKSKEPKGKEGGKKIPSDKETKIPQDKENQKETKEPVKGKDAEKDANASKEENVSSKEEKPTRDEQVKGGKDPYSLEAEKGIEKDQRVQDKGQEQREKVGKETEGISEKQETRETPSKEETQSQRSDSVSKDAPVKEPQEKDVRISRKERFPVTEEKSDKDVSDGKEKDIPNATEKDAKDISRDGKELEKADGKAEHQGRDDRQEVKGKDVPEKPIEKDMGLSVSRRTPQMDPSKTQYVYQQGGESYVVEVTEDSDPDMAFGAVEDRMEEREAIEEREEMEDREVEIIIEKDDGSREVRYMQDRQREMEQETIDKQVYEEERIAEQARLEREEAELEEERRFEEMSVEDKNVSLNDIITAATAASVATAVVAPNLGKAVEGKDTLWEGLEELTGSRDIRSF